MAAKKAAKKTPAKPANQTKSKRGGSRAGAGRKPSPNATLKQAAKAAVRSTCVERADPDAADPGVQAAIKQALLGLCPAAIVSLARLVEGGYQRVEVRKVAAGTVMVNKPVMRRGEIVLDDHGRVVYAEVPLYPHLPPEELVEIDRKESIADADRNACIFVVEQTLGKARQAVEMTGKDGGKVQVEIYLPDNGRDTQAQAQLPAPGDLVIDQG